jgi:hypothetical protein
MAEVCGPDSFVRPAAADEAVDDGLDGPGRGLVAVDGCAEAAAPARLVSEGGLCESFLVVVSRSPSCIAFR